MFSSTENVCNFFDLVRQRISNKLVIKEINSDQVILRSDMKNTTEAYLFVLEYAALTQSRFRATSKSRARIYSTPGQKWICTYRRMIAGTLKMSPKCPAMISVVIKKVTKFSKVNDADLRGATPLRAVIKINPNHNHILEDPCLERFLRVSSPVKDCFFEYFKRGIVGSKAKLFHEQNLKKANFVELDDESMNPSLRAVFALYRQWKKLENVQLNKVSIPEVSETVHAMNVPMDNVAQFTPDSSHKVCNSEVYLDSDSTQIVCKIEIEPVEDTYLGEFKNEVLQDFSDAEDVKPVLNIKKEIDEDAGLPVIESYCSVATPPSTNSTPVKREDSEDSDTVVDNSINVMEGVLKYLADTSPKYGCTDYSKSQYNSYSPHTLLPHFSRVALHRI